MSLGLRRNALVASAALAFALPGCGDSPAESDGVVVVATTTVIADLARQVVGERGTVQALLRPGADPHDYEPRPSDVRALEGADVVLSAGGEVDEWLDDVLGAGDAEEVVLSESLGLPSGGDPHWWLDPRQAARATGVIADVLGSADPASAGAYTARGRRARARIERLDAAIERCLRPIPEARRRLVTTHESLAWLARRYDLEVVGAVIPSTSGQAQPSAGAVQGLVEAIRSGEVAAVFPESALDARLERAIAREAGARVGRPLWVDALGEEGSGAATYVEAMASNAESLVDGLTGGARACRPATGAP